MVCFYDKDGMLVQRFDYSHDISEKEFTTASFNPSGETVILGSFDRFRTFTFSQHDGAWQDIGITQVDNMYTVTAAAWKCDGSRLTLGSLCGAVDLYDACIRRVRYKGRFEFTYVSTSTVIVKRLASGARIVLKSHFGYEITRINIYEDRFLIAVTVETLLIGDLESCKLSEVPWVGSGEERCALQDVADFCHVAPSAAHQTFDP
jgi:intraflagellar transport protein 172